MAADTVDPKRLVVMKKLCDHLMNEVSTANGYQHDLNGKVFRGRNRFGTPEELPFVSILEALNPDREPQWTDAGRVSREEWVLLIQGFVPDDLAHPTDPAHRLMADVKKALCKLNDYSPGVDLEVYRLGGLVGDIRIEPGTVRPPAEGVSDSAFFYLRVILEFVEDLGEHYDLS